LRLPKIQLWMFRLAYCVFLAFFCWVSGLVVYRMFTSHLEGKPYFQFEGIYGKPLNPFGVLAGALGLAAILSVVFRKLTTMGQQALRLCTILLFGGFLLVQLVFVSCFQVVPTGWDLEMVHLQAAGLAQGRNDYGYYFDDYSNNLGISCLLALVFRLADWLGANDLVRVATWFNIFMIDLAIWLTYLTARRLFGPGAAVFVLVLCLCFSPFITYTPIYYTDTIALPFAAGMLYGYTAGLDKPPKRQLLYTGWAAVAGTAGALIKPTMAILLVAVGIHGLLASRPRQVLLQLSMLVSLWVAGQFLYAVYIDSTGILSRPYKESGYPYTHWIMMGLKQPFGFYDADDVLYTESFSTKEARKQANLAKIRERLRNYGAEGTIRLFAAKTIFTWGDGTYFAPVKLNRGLTGDNRLHSVFLPKDRNQNGGYIYYCQSFQLLLLACFVRFGLNRIRSPDRSALFVCALAVLGLGLFLLVWEDRSRYLIHFAPFMLLCCAAGFMRIPPGRNQTAKPPVS